MLTSFVPWCQVFEMLKYESLDNSLTGVGTLNVLSSAADCTSENAVPARPSPGAPSGDPNERNVRTDAEVDREGEPAPRRKGAATDGGRRFLIDGRAAEAERETLLGGSRRGSPESRRPISARASSPGRGEGSGEWIRRFDPRIPSC